MNYRLFLGSGGPRDSRLLPRQRGLVPSEFVRLARLWQQALFLALLHRRHRGRQPHPLGSQRGEVRVRRNKVKEAFYFLFIFQNIYFIPFLCV
jgi:hypothetical protein